MKKGKKWVVIFIIVIILLLVIAGIVYVLLFSNQGGSFSFGGADFSQGVLGSFKNGNIFENVKLNPFTNSS